MTAEIPATTDPPVCNRCNKTTPITFLCPECSALPRRTHGEECKEWQAIADAALRGDQPVTAFDVTQEQYRRMAARGERASTYAEILADAKKAYVGRIVHYHSYGTPGGEYKPAPRAAIVTEVHDVLTGDVSVCVLNPEGMFFKRVPYSPTPKPGSWMTIPEET
jgi:hypothetical protein